MTGRGVSEWIFFVVPPHSGCPGYRVVKLVAVVLLTVPFMA